MVARLMVLIAVELAILLFLAVQVAAGPAPPSPTDAPPTEAGTAPAAVGPAHVAAHALEPAAAAEQPAPAAAPRTEIAARWNANDPVGVLLTGTVRWRDGRPVAGPSVTAQCGSESRSADGGADGTFAVVGLFPGEWTLRLRADGAADADAPLTITDDAVQQRDFTLDASYPVRVLVVTSDGQDATRALRLAVQSFPDFRVAGQRDRFPDRLAPTDYGAVFVGDAQWDGEMNPKDGLAGTLRFTAAPPAHAALLLRHLVLEQQIVQPGQEEVRFVVDPEALKRLAGSVAVRVLDADNGAPLPNARVMLNTSNMGVSGQPVDAEGRAVVQGAPGLLHCSISAPDHEHMHTTVRVEVGQRLDLGDVRLGAMLPLTGRVFDSEGKPAAATLHWTELKWRTSPTAFATNRIARAAADGSFTLWGTGRGRIAVTARGDGSQVAVGVFDNPPASPAELRLAPAAECRVRRSTDVTRAFTLTVFDGEKQPVAAHTLQPAMATWTLTLPAGSYRFEVHDEQDRPVQSGTLQLGAVPTTLEIR